MQLTTITSKGQVTIPKELRIELGLKPGDKVIFEKGEKGAKMRPIPDFFALKGSLKSRKKYDKKQAREAIGRYLANKYLRSINK